MSNKKMSMLFCLFLFPGIKAIKLYSWEKPYVERIAKLREEELKRIWKTGLLLSINRMMFLAGPILIALAGFGTYIALGGRITAAVAFPALALFNILQFPIIVLPMQIMAVVYGKVALNRIQRFMNCEEIEKNFESEWNLVGQTRFSRNAY